MCGLGVCCAPTQHVPKRVWVKEEWGVVVCRCPSWPFQRCGPRPLAKATHHNDGRGVEVFPHTQQRCLPPVPAKRLRAALQQSGYPKGTQAHHPFGDRLGDLGLVVTLFTRVYSF